MDYSAYQNMLSGGSNVFMWIMYILTVTTLLLGIVALLKYIGKK